MLSINKKFWNLVALVLVATPYAYSADCPIDITSPEERQQRVRDAEISLSHYENPSQPGHSQSLTERTLTPAQRESERLRDLRITRTRLKFLRTCRIQKEANSCSRDSIAADRNECLSTFLTTLLGQSPSNHLAFSVNINQGPGTSSNENAGRILSSQSSYNVDPYSSTCQLAVSGRRRGNRITVPENYIVRITGVIDSAAGRFSVSDARGIFSELHCSPRFVPPGESSRCFTMDYFLMINQAQLLACSGTTSSNSAAGAPQHAPAPSAGSANH